MKYDIDISVKMNVRFHFKMLPDVQNFPRGYCNTS